MITKREVREDLKKAFGNELRLNQLNEEKVLNFVFEQILKACKPQCTHCYDKGYSTSFPDESSSRMRILYCPCSSGQSLKEVIGKNYQPIE